MGWLRRTFRIPTDWGSKRLVLHFEAVAGGFHVLVNGVVAGQHFDSHLPAEFDITSLVQRDGDNELLVGVRHPHLFDRRSKRYEKFSAPYPPGSNTDALAGIWQDVFLLGLPAVRIADVFIQPNLQTDRLDVIATLRNDTLELRDVEMGGTYYASPRQLSVFNGERAYESYLGRNEALAIDLYQNVVKVALPSLA